MTEHDLRHATYQAIKSIVWAFVCVFCYVTHFVVCAKTSAWVLFVIGGLFFPAGIVNGALYWVNFFALA